MPDQGETSEIESMISDQGLGLPDKPISDMDSRELILLADESSVAEQLKSQETKPDPTPAEPTEAPPPEPPEPAKPAEPGEGDVAAKKSNLEQWQAMVDDAQGTGEGDELGRLRADRDRLQRELDKRRDSEIEDARAQLRGEAAGKDRGPEPDGSSEVNYSELVPYFVSEYGLEREQAERLMPAIGRMMDARALQVVNSEVAPLKKDLADSREESAKADKETHQAQEVVAGMDRLSRLGGTARDLVKQYLDTGGGQLADYLAADPARQATSLTVYDAGLALTAIIDTATSARDSGDGGSTSLAPEGSDRSQRIDETREAKTWEEKVADGLSESARPFRETIPFLDKDYLQEGK